MPTDRSAAGRPTKRTSRPESQRTKKMKERKAERIGEGLKTESRCTSRARREAGRDKHVQRCKRWRTRECTVVIVDTLTCSLTEIIMRGASLRFLCLMVEASRASSIDPRWWDGKQRPERYINICGTANRRSPYFPHLRRFEGRGTFGERSVFTGHCANRRKLEGCNRKWEFARCTVF